MDITERFINYTRFDTQSAEDSDSVPSTARQLVFAQYLKKELEDEGLDDVELDEKGYLYATLKANIKDEVPTIGFIAHYDTSPDCSGANVNARIIKDDHGDDIIVTDGTTLLGADDKAGIAEIVEAMVYLKAHPDIKHGKIRIAFNPDEEIGRGAEHFDVEHFGCQWAYTMDGGELGELEYENFNAAQAKITVKGFNVHPGYAKDRMRNANRIAMQLAAMLPQEETPEATEGYQGFYHLTAMTGTVEEAHLSYILRDHDRSRFDDRKRMMERCCETINAQYGEGTATLVMRDQYYNMREQLEPDNMHVIDVVLKAMQECGISPKVKPIRGGTDGAQLSFRGLPCPNIFAGSEMMHSTEEHVSVATMQKAKELIIKICQHVGSFNS